MHRSRTQPCHGGRQASRLCFGPFSPLRCVPSLLLYAVAGPCCPSCKARMRAVRHGLRRMIVAASLLPQRPPHGQVPRLWVTLCYAPLPSRPCFKAGSLGKPPSDRFG